MSKRPMNTNPMNRRSKITAQVHRFHAAVAAYLGTGETVYLTPAEARKFARALNAAARDCDRQPDFGKSEFSTTEFEFGAATYERCGA